MGFLPRFILAAIFTALLSYVALAFPYGHGGGAAPAPPAGDVFQTALNTACGGNTSLHNCWVDLGVQSGVTQPAISGLFPSPLPCTNGGTPGCNTGPTSVTDTWSGCAEDGANSVLACTGGGHSDYCGNEVYVMKLTVTLDWTRPFGPSTCDNIAPGNTGVTQLASTTNCTALGAGATGCPTSVHSYGSFGFIPSKGFVRVGGARWVDGNAVIQTWVWNAGVTATVRYDDAPTWSYGVVGVYNTTDSKFYIFGAINGNAVFDPTQSTGSQWVNHNQDSPFGCGGGAAGYCGGAYDAVNNLLWLVGEDTGAGQLYSFSTGGIRSIKTIGGSATCNVLSAPGLGWRPSDHKLYCFVPGNASVWTLDTNACAAGTCTWVQVSPNGANTVTPPTLGGSNQGGAFNKGGLYDAAHDAFLYVPNTGAHVYAYKP